MQGEYAQRILTFGFNTSRGGEASHTPLTFHLYEIFRHQSLI